MTISIKKSRRVFPVAPGYISDLVSFVVNYTSEDSLVREFCFVVKKCSSKKEFEEHNNSFVPQTELEQELMELLDNFYKKADKHGEVDNKRGNLLEHLIYQLSLAGKYASHQKWFFATLDIVDDNNQVLFSIDPHNIDFFFEDESQDDRAAIDCKIKVREDEKQLQSFDNFAKEVEKHGISCLIGVIHLIRERAWIEKYKTWYQKIEFIGPDDLRDRFV